MKTKYNTKSGLDIDEREYIIENYIRQRKTYRQMCELMGISKGMFQLLLKKYDVPARHVGGRR